MYYCFVCSKSFTHKHYLRRHILNSHEGSSCENCEEVFVTDEQYCSHFKQFHLTEDLTCVICSKRFDNSDLVEANMKNFHSAASNIESGNEAGIDDSVPCVRVTVTVQNNEIIDDSQIIGSPAK